VVSGDETLAEWPGKLEEAGVDDADMGAEGVHAGVVCAWAIVEAHGGGDACVHGTEPAVHAGTEDEARACATGIWAAEIGGESIAASSRRKSKESSAGRGFSWAKGNVNSSKTTCREVMMRRVDRSRQR
jgi:hypothetical protein